METFKELTIQINDSQIPGFLSQIEKYMKDGWSRNYDLEKSNMASAGNIVFYYFTCTERGNREAALVALVKKDDNSVHVSNVVPQNLSELSYCQYNLILTEFYEKFVKPSCEILKLKTELSKGEETINDWMSEISVERLKSFSSLANKSTGTSHPFDKERWYNFVISIVENNDKLESSELVRWLVEEESWAEDVARDISIEFEQEVGLLKQYLKGRTV